MKCCLTCQYDTLESEQCASCSYDAVSGGSAWQPRDCDWEMVTYRMHCVFACQRDVVQCHQEASAALEKKKRMWCMNAELNIFAYDENMVRTSLDEKGDIWFVAKDVCAVLEIDKYHDAVARLDEDERGSVVVDTLGDQQKMSAITESGLGGITPYRA